MKKKHEHIIESVRPGSIAEELGIVALCICPIAVGKKVLAFIVLSEAETVLGDSRRTGTHKDDGVLVPRTFG